jgi:serine/threonine protein kinase
VSLSRSRRVTTVLPWQPDLRVAGRYRLQDRIGAGASAEVWRAVDDTLDAAVAIKLLDPMFARTEIATRFLREARAAAKIRSLHVVQILDHGLHGETPYISMELLEGETLADRLDRDGCLPPRVASRIIVQVAKATAKAHAEGIVHRDLKPENIFLVQDEDAEEPLAKVFDFGIAKVLPRRGAPLTDVTKAGSLLGTPEIMSPEQARGLPVDHRTDLYSLAIVAFRCFTGGLPFASEDVEEILQCAAAGKLLRPSDVASVPMGFDAWFARASAYEPEARFASAKEMAAALTELPFDD